MLAMLARCALVACCVNLSRRSNPTAKRRAIRSSQWTLRIQSACFLADCRFCRKSSEIQSARELKVRRSEEHTSELQSLMRITYAVFCLKKKIQVSTITTSSYDSKLYAAPTWHEVH